MRLLIYLLALISGFSAAEAARAEVTPASSVAQTAAAASEALAAHVAVDAAWPAHVWPTEVTRLEPADVPVPIAANTPLLRHDLSRE
jgi:hypothetical protein